MGNYYKTNSKETNMKTRTELMQELNYLLGTNHNWSRLNLLDLQRLIEGINKIRCDRCRMTLQETKE